MTMLAKLLAGGHWQKTKIDLLKVYSPIPRTGSPQGVSLVQILQEAYKKLLDYLVYNTKHAHYRNVNYFNIIQKLVPSVLLS